MAAAPSHMTARLREALQLYPATEEEHEVDGEDHGSNNGDGREFNDSVADEGTGSSCSLWESCSNCSGWEQCTCSDT